MNKRIAVLLTTFNRREKTINCLQTLRAQQLPPGVSLHVYVTDDASKDGTADAIRGAWPDAIILHGNGSLFWAGGMRQSWTKATTDGGFDYYFLLNDDTMLRPDAIVKLLDAKNADGKTLHPAIVVGSTTDSEHGTISYGGKKVRSKLRFTSYQVHSESEYVSCHLGNANIMLVPAEIVNKVGILSNSFTHGIADYDYTMKTIRAGFGVYVAPGILGYCTDDHGNNWKSSNVKLRDRIRYLKSPKGLAYREYLGFIKDHFPAHYPSAFVKLWMKTLFPFVWDSFKNKRHA